ncbi:unnamed protein product, partial [marine sediment metagenome]
MRKTHFLLAILLAVTTGCQRARLATGQPAAAERKR